MRAAPYLGCYYCTRRALYLCDMPDPASQGGVCGRALCLDHVGRCLHGAACRGHGQDRQAKVDTQKEASR